MYRRWWREAWGEAFTPAQKVLNTFMGKETGALILWSTRWKALGYDVAGMLLQGVAGPGIARVMAKCRAREAQRKESALSEGGESDSSIPLH